VLAELVRVLEENPDVGLAGPLNYSYREPGKLLSAGGFVHPLLARTIHETSVPAFSGPFWDVEFIYGCAS